MWGWLTSLMQGLATSIIEAFMQARKEDKAKADEFARRSLEEYLKSMSESEKTVKEIREAQASVKPISREDWNKGVLPLLALILFLGGCCTDKTIAVRDKRPAIEIVEPRPKLDLTAKETPNEAALLHYALVLEKAIKAYNEAAAAYNSQNPGQGAPKP
jgi:hypothetical protein